MKQLTDAVQAEQKMYAEMLHESMPASVPTAANREQRRAQAKHQNRRGDPVSFRAQPAAARMVERVDSKAARREELLRELAALDNG